MPYQPVALLPIQALRDTVLTLRSVAVAIAVPMLLIVVTAAAAKVQTTLERVPEERWKKLLLCVLVDLAGDASVVGGEWLDIIWAPLSVLLVQRLFGVGLWSALAGVEELLPYADFVPTATLCWLLETLQQEQRERSKLDAAGQADG